MTAELKTQMVEHNQGQVQQMQIIEGSPSSPHHAPNSMANQQAPHSTTTISTMSPLQLPTGQVPADWSHGRLQVLQPSLSNQGYLQHLYSPVLMSGNLLHSGLGQQPIQVIASGKAFQGGQLTPQMLTATAQSKPMLSGTTGSFSGAYTLPTIPSSQSQTLLFSPVSVISSQPQQQQQNLLPTMAAPSNKNSQSEVQKSLQGQKVLQKVSSTTSMQNSQNMNGPSTANSQSAQQCVQVSQAMPTAQIISPLQQAGSQPMQITAPWLQSVPQFWTNGIQPQTLLAPNPIIIRGTQPDGTQGMFIPQATSHQQVQSQQQNQTLTLPTTALPQVSTATAIASKSRSQVETLAPKQQIRGPPILPQNGPPIRPASSVSTQTAQNQNLINQKQNKLRNKQQAVRPALPTIKTDASNQTKSGMSQIQQQQQQAMQQVVTSAGNKMVVMSTGTPVNIQSGQIAQQNQSQNDKQFHMQQIKQQQQTLIHQQQLLMQQTPNQQLIPHHQITQQFQLQQHQPQVQQQLNHQATQQGTQQTQFITQQQQQQQIQNQLMQQQQHQQPQQHQLQQQHSSHQQLQQSHHQHQQQQQQHQQHHHHQQQQIQQQQIQQQQQQQQQQHQRDNQGQQQQGNIIHQIVVQQQPTSQVQTIPISVASNTSNLQSIALQSKHQMNLSQSLDRQAVVSIASPHSQQTVSQVNSPVSQSSSNLNNSDGGTHLTLTNSISSTTSIGLQSPPNPILAMTALTTSTLSQSSSTVSTSSNAKPAEIKQSISVENISNGTDKKHVNTMEVKSSSVNSVQTSQTIINSNANNRGNGPTSKGNENNVPDSNKTSNHITDNVAENKTLHANEDKKTEQDHLKPQMDESCVKALVTSSNLQKSSHSNVKTEKDLPKAMIKPNVLTHVIEGFVIQEANEPFAVTRQRYSEKEALGEPPKKRIALEETTNKEVSGDTMACEQCGKQEAKSKLKKKRYCSLTCARAPKISSNDQISDTGLSNTVEDHSINKTNELSNNLQTNDESSHQSQEMTLKAAHTSTQEDIPLMVEWTVSDVCEFIKNLPGCSDYADDFAMQEIDGQALLLLKENHLVNAMGMKLGPALKIVAKVESMKENSGLDKEQQ